MTFAVPFARKAELTKTPGGVDISTPAIESETATRRRVAVSADFSAADQQWFEATFGSDLTTVASGLPSDWQRPPRKTA